MMRNSKGCSLSLEAEWPCLVWVIMLKPYYINCVYNKQRKKIKDNNDKQRNNIPVSFSDGSDVKVSAQVQSLGWEDPLEKEMATHSSILPGESHGQRSLVGYSSWGLKESDTTEQLSHTHMFLLLENMELSPKWCSQRQEDTRPSWNSA